MITVRTRRAGWAAFSAAGALAVAVSGCAPEHLMTLTISDPVECNETTDDFVVTNYSPWPAHIEVVLRSSSAVVPVVDTDLVAPNGGAAHVTVPAPHSFDVWFTYEGGPPPTTSTFTTIGDPIEGIGSVDGPATMVGGLASGVLHSKFWCIGNPIG